jgi:3'-5' exonuclease
VISNISLDQLLLLDIETTPVTAALNQLPENMQSLWLDKIAKTLPETADGAYAYVDKAGLSAEFGRIVCISVGFFRAEGGRYQLRIKSFYNDDEKVVLNSFLELVNNFHIRDFLFAGHNIKEFDIPFICRRSVVHQLSLPQPLQLHGRKPWEMNMLDTMSLWRFGDTRTSISLKLMTAVLGIPSPKDDMDGSLVGKTYWEEHNLEKIAAYCQKDVVAVGQLLLRLKGVPLLEPEDVIYK